MPGAPVTRTVLGTGTSSGIGQATAVRAAVAGWRVVATMRDPSRAAGLLAEAESAGVEVDVLRLDVTDHASIAECLAAVARRHGRLDAVVDNAGTSNADPTLEMSTRDALRSALETNFIGAVEVSRLAMPMLRAARGRLLTVGSVHGVRGQPVNHAYTAAKFALKGFSASLAPWQAVPRWSGVASPLEAMGLSLQGDVVSELLRPVGLAALVWLVLRWVPRDAGWLGARWAVAVAAVGRHSLPIFVAGVLLSSLVTVLALVAGGSAAVYALLTLAGIALHLVVATHWPRRTPSGRRAVPQHVRTSAEGVLEPVGERVGDRPPPGVEHDVVGDTGQDDGPGVVRRSGGADLRDGEHGVVLPADHE